MHIPVKICGITSYQDAKLAISYGSSAIGFIFFKKSKRYVCPDEVQAWIDKLPENCKKVGVFVNEKVDAINTIIDKLNLDMIQLHGNETPDFCNRINKPIIKAFRVGINFDFKTLEKYDVSAFLFDNYKKGEKGGTGEVFDWDLVSNYKTSTPIILSGGLNLENISYAIDKVSPAALDLNSGVESSPGVKDEEKINKVFKKISSIKGSNKHLKGFF